MKKTAVPKDILIGGKRFSVTVEAFRSPDAGMIHHTEQRIMLNDAQHSESMKDTLLHEVIHGVDYQLNLEMEERQVHALAAGLIEVLWNNPQFARWVSAR